MTIDIVNSLYGLIFYIKSSKKNVIMTRGAHPKAHKELDKSLEKPCLTN